MIHHILKDHFKVTAQCPSPKRVPWNTGAVRCSIREEGMGFCGQEGLESHSGLSPRQCAQILATEVELEVSVALQ